MDSSENGDRVFQQKNSIGMVMSGNSLDPFTGSDWDPMYHIGNFGNSSMVPQKESDNNNPHYSLVELQSHINSSDSVRYPCDQSIVDRLPIIPTFEIGNFPEMINSRSGSISQNNATPRNAHSGENRQNSEDGLLGASASPNNGKRRKLVLQGTSPKNTHVERKEDAYEKTYESPEDKDEKKHKSEGNGLCTEPSKEDYFHVRAKKGQATNSHSLAERLRRERISERMKLLQELVPGCNKITGKAVMLDEIINYVQSLQNQVEFLSMKLATANPELNMDIEPVLSGDILHSQGNNATVHGNHLGWSSSHPYPGFSRGTFDGASSTTSAFLSLPHNSWKNSELHTGYNFDPSSSGLGPNGM